MKKKKKKKQATVMDIIKASRKKSREEEITNHTKPVNYAKIIPSKKLYNRKRNKPEISGDF
ncbi:MAG: hypothetical protein LUG18_00265 [Candidatus Azobacteroides sp.]|nr:hypothetical protein [Candidatus Azobacteroides sp.]